MFFFFFQRRYLSSRNTKLPSDYPRHHNLEKILAICGRVTADHLRAPAWLCLNTPGPYSQLFKFGLGLVSHTVEIHSSIHHTHTHTHTLSKLTENPALSFLCNSPQDRIAHFYRGDVTEACLYPSIEAQRFQVRYSPPKEERTREMLFVKQPCCLHTCHSPVCLTAKHPSLH